MPEEKYLIQVKDFGKGIPEEAVDTIFEPFAKVRGMIGSSNLGLAISANIVDYLLKGNIRLQNEIGQGKSFSIYLPKVVPQI